MKVITFLFTFSSAGLVTARSFLVSGDVVTATKPVSSLSETAMIDQDSTDIISKRTGPEMVEYNSHASSSKAHPRPSGSKFDAAKWKKSWNDGAHPLDFLGHQDPQPSGFTPEQKAKWIVDPATHFMRKPKVSQSSYSKVNFDSRSREDRMLNLRAAHKAGLNAPTWSSVWAQWEAHRYYRPNLNVAEQLGSKPGPSKFNIKWTEDPALARSRYHAHPKRIAQYPADWNAHVCYVLDKMGCKLGTSVKARIVVPKSGDPYAKISRMKPRYRSSRGVHIGPDGEVARVPPADPVGWWKEFRWNMKNPDVDDPIVTPWED